MIKIKEKQFSIFLKAGKEKEYQKDQIIYHQKDVGNSLFLVKKGRVRAYQVGEDGTEINFEVLDKGSLFGDSSLIGDSTRPATVVAVSDCMIIETTLEKIKPYLLKDGELCYQLLQMMIERCDYLNFQIKSEVIYDRYQKVAAFLIRNASEDQPSKEIYDHSLPYTHEDIANSVHLRRPTVSKILSEFQKEGYIRMKYKHIQLIDSQGLKKKYFSEDL